MRCLDRRTRRPVHNLGDTLLMANDTESVAGELGRRIVSDIREFDLPDAVDRVKTWTSENPVAAVSIALGIGICVGVLIDANRTDNEDAERPATLKRAIRTAGNQLKAMAQDVSENVVSDVQEKYATVADRIDLPDTDEVKSFADTILATAVSLAARKFQSWIKARN